MSYNDITEQFIPWLNQATGQIFRLSSEAEWEYAARAGSTTEYPWGNDIDCSKAQYDGGKDSSCYREPNGEDRGTAPVKTFKSNDFGLFDMPGNVWELVQDCYHNSYKGAPQNGSAWLSGDCSFDRVLRGGSWFLSPVYSRSADRNGFPTTVRHRLIGFRLAQDLN